MNTTDTIAAISTGLTEAGIGIIRISGPDALRIRNALFVGKHESTVPVPARAYYGHLYENEVCLDEVLCTYFKAPFSYTAEDLAEISCHGGVFGLRRILEAVLRNGARLAEPGEFTKRAFLNGRIDLDQAEAVSDLISSSNEAAMRLSLSQLEGGLSKKLKGLREDILKECAFVEACLDDPEHMELTGYPPKLEEKLKNICHEMEQLLAGFREGRLIREGIRTVILGRPNVGKSSLLNALSGMERAIVSAYPGTTRDTLEEYISLGDFTLHLIDTAGIRETEDPVEQMGVERAKKEMEKADLALLLLDASEGFTKEDEKLFSSLPDIPKIVLWNKTDLANAPEYPEGLSVSAKTGKNMEQIKKKVSDIIFDQKQILIDGSLLITKMRHSELVKEALSSLNQVLQTISDGLPEDFYLPDLMDAYRSLGSIMGEEVEEDLVDRIFSEFCMGK